MNQKSTRGDPRKFIGPMFDLGYGGSDEQLSREEIRAQLRETGIDPDAGWAKTARLLEAAKGKLRLEDARAARLAAAHREAVSAIAPETKESLIAQIKELFSSAGTGMSAMYARKWTEGSLEDLALLRDQLKRTIDREAKRRDGRP